MTGMSIVMVSLAADQELLHPSGSAAFTRRDQAQRGHVSLTWPRDAILHAPAQSSFANCSRISAFSRRELGVGSMKAQRTTPFRSMRMYARPE